MFRMLSLLISTRTCAIFFSLVVTFFGIANAQMPVLVKDINTAIEAGRGLCSGSRIQPFGNGFVFCTSSVEEGDELWISDGTSAGTRILKDIWPGPSSSFNASTIQYIEYNNHIYFTAENGIAGKELWRTDGTEVGTQMVRDIAPGSESSIPARFTVHNGLLYFTADDQLRGSELWRTDGTSIGTSIVADITPGEDSSRFFTTPTSLNSLLLFSTENETNGRELWRSDGTSIGTFMLRDINPGPSSGAPTSIRVVGGLGFFTADDGVNGRELWVTNGNARSTYMVIDGDPGSASSTIRNQAVFKNQLFYRGDNGGLWKSDGTESGTVEVAAGLSVEIGSFLATQNLLYLEVDDPNFGEELWTSDGTESGTAILKDIAVGQSNSNSFQLVEVGNTVFFTADDGLNGRALWKTQGTNVSTQLVNSIRTDGVSPQIDRLTNVGGTLFFQADDGVAGLELWRSDGTPNGTTIFKNLWLGSEGSTPRFGVDSTAVGNTLFTTLDDGIHGVELWKSDGSEPGTQLVKDIFPGLGGGISELTSYKNKVFFSANDGVHGSELWMSDGTSAGTQLVKDIRASELSSAPRNLTVYQGTLYFFAIDDVNGQELWRSDGTESGTQLVTDARPGTLGLSGGNLTVANDLMFFGARETAGSDYALWRSDGTASGTIELLSGFDSSLTSGDDREKRFLSVGSTLFFAGETDAEGDELWKSDGTTAGTVLIEDINPGPGDGIFAGLGSLNGIVYFGARDPDGFSLWRSDGFALGTRKLKAGLLVTEIQSSMNYLHMAVNDQNNNNASNYWISDGTEAGTVKTAAESPDRIFYTGIEDIVLMSARTDANGAELWTGDGTVAGVKLLKDIYQGNESGSPFFFTQAGSTSYFFANSPNEGRELWALRLEEDAEELCFPIVASNGSVAVICL